MSGLSYDELVERLFPRLTGGVRWGLERTLRLLEAAGDPHRAYPSIHIGGSNGKGSVAAIVESVLRSHGLRTGLYTSPHLIDFRERIRIDGVPISRQALVSVARDLWPAVEREDPSFFEATTFLALAAFRRAAVDVAVLEVGMGGRLDSTNVVRPEVAAITSVAMDHAEFLGDDLLAVAREKAGIMKGAVPVVTGESGPAILDLLRDRARAVGAPLHEVESRSLPLADPEGVLRLPSMWGELDLQLPLRGRHQAANAAVALRVLELLPDPLRPSREAVEAGVASTRWPGRLQVERVDRTSWLFDIAHNPAGVRSLLDALPELRLPRPLAALVGILGDKDWPQMLPPLLEAVDEVVLCDPSSAPEARRWDPERVLEALGTPHNVRIVRPFAAAVAAAVERAGGGTVLCTGSVHTVGDTMATLHIEPFPADAGLQSGPRAG